MKKDKLIIEYIELRYDIPKEICDKYDGKLVNGKCVIEVKED